MLSARFDQAGFSQLDDRGIGQPPLRAANPLVSSSFKDCCLLAVPLLEASMAQKIIGPTNAIMTR